MSQRLRILPFGYYTRDLDLPRPFGGSDGATRTAEQGHFAKLNRRTPSGVGSALRHHVSFEQRSRAWADHVVERVECNLPAPNGQQHYFSSSGEYGDNVVYDVGSALKLDGKPVQLTRAYGADCLAMAYQGLAVRAVIVCEDEDGVHHPADNCPEASNVEQLDSDSDADYDGDLRGDACDNCPCRRKQRRQRPRLVPR